MKRFLCIVTVLLFTLCACADSVHELAYKQAEACIFSSEYGGSFSNAAKWTGQIRVFIGGNYNASDVGFFYTFTKTMAENVPDMPDIVLVNDVDDANVTMYFVKLNEMMNYLDSYTEGNWGYFNCFWNGNHEIYRGRIAIAYDKCDSDARRHLMMEEFIGMLGIGNDHYLDSKSILYQNWTTTQALTSADWNMIRMLYNPQVYAGMSKSAALDVMKNIY